MGSGTGCGAARRGALRRGTAPLLALVAVACARGTDAWHEDLASPDPFVRGVAAIGMALHAPPEAGPAIPVLLRTIDRKDVGLEFEAAWALIRVGPFHVQALLQELVRDELMSDDRRGAIKHALVAAGPAAARPIVTCMSGPGLHLVGDLGEVLLQIGEPAVRPLAELLAMRGDPRILNFAAYLLARLGPVARPALPALRDALDSPFEDVRAVARQAIESIEGRASRGVGR